MAKYKNKTSLKWQIKRVFKNWFLLDLLAFTFYVFDIFFKKNEKRLLFIFGKEENYADNSRILFEYLNKEKDLEVLLFIYKKDLYENLKKDFPDQTYYAYSFKGLFIFLQTNRIVISYGLDKLYFFPYYLSIRYKTIIQLWHGSLFKRLGFQTKGWNKIKSKKELQQFSKFIACSSLERFMISSCFNLNIDDILITDYPRNDKLFHPDKGLVEKHPYLQKKIILYAPTWREEGRKTIFFPFEDANLSEIQKVLEDTDSYILVRGHREEMDQIRNKYGLSIDECNRIVLADQVNFPFTEELLPYVDILVTDYSGIYIDFLLLNRPVLFIPYDLDDYSTYRGVLFDYNKFTAGPKVSTQKEFLEEIKMYIQNPKKDEDLRVKMQEIFHDNIDGKACERILLKLKN
jgi:CDP-glycerol glycerophosphotransferase (TagB/SpsB family)